MKTRIAVLFAVLAASAAAQLTMQQRVDDFTYLSSLLNRNYAPYEWKKQVFGFDLLDLKPWLERVRNARTDAEFHDICIEYVASLKDYNTYLELPSDFEAYLGFTVDLWDGRALVEFIDRRQLPAARYAIALGDELISIDGRPVAGMIEEHSKYAMDGNPKATQRLAADSLTYRSQMYNPRAAEAGRSSRVELRKASDGSVVTLDLPWEKSGTPMQTGPLPDFTAETAAAPAPYYERLLGAMDRGGRTRSAARRTLSAEVESTTPEIQGIGTLAPLYALPTGFRTRVGTGRTDQIYSGWYEAEGKRIGLLRIPVFSGSAGLYSQLETEIAWLNENTDVLVLDQMRDRMQSICGAERIAARFIGKPFRQPGFEVRSTWATVLNFELAVESAIENGADPVTIAGLEGMLRDLRTAYSENRGRTGPLPLCETSIDRQPVTDRNGRVIGYTKPILLVTDELSSDFFAAALKDAGVAKQFGIRTRGVMGTGVAVPGPAYTEMTVYMKDSIMTRASAVRSPGYPDSPYVESTGVHPEFVADFMTLENYRQRGAPFVEAFTRAALSLTTPPQ